MSFRPVREDVVRALTRSVELRYVKPDKPRRWGAVWHSPIQSPSGDLETSLAQGPDHCSRESGARARCGRVNFVEFTRRVSIDFGRRPPVPLRGCLPAVVRVAMVPRQTERRAPGVNPGFAGRRVRIRVLVALSACSGEAGVRSEKRYQRPIPASAASGRVALRRPRPRRSAPWAGWIGPAGTPKRDRMILYSGLRATDRLG